MLQASDLGFMRASQALAMPDTCSILRVSRASDGKGGTTETWNTLASGVTCRLAVISGVQRDSNGVLRDVRETVITVPHGQDVTTKDRVTLGGVTYSVTGVRAHTWQTAKQLVVQAV